MRYDVNANRMMLTRTRKRLAVARRGHTLMKHKLEELMHLFQAEVDGVLQIREELNARLHALYASFVPAKSLIDPEVLAGIFSTSVLRTQINVKTEHLLNLKVPVFSCTIEGEHPPYGLLDTCADLDTTVYNLKETLPRLFELAQKERRLMLLIRELETTRRRVNALEFVLIPQIEEQARYIQMKLDEMERSNTSRLMRIKSIIRKE